MVVSKRRRGKRKSTTKTGVGGQRVGAGKRNAIRNLQAMQQTMDFLEREEQRLLAEQNVKLEEN